jgi:hypothetical protein
MNFQVPQFIEEQPKIVGFLTLPEFLYLAAGGGVSFLCFYVFSIFLWVIITVVIAAIVVGLAFVKINGQPMPKVLAAAFGYVWSPRQFTWQRAMQESELDTSNIEKFEAARRSMKFQEKLKSLTLSVTTGKIFSSLNSGPTETKKEKRQAVTFLTGEKQMAKRIDY